MDIKSEKIKDNKPKNELYIIDSGDPSVGLNPTSWTVEPPFIVSKEDAESLADFKKAVLEAYQPYTEGRLSGVYAYELEHLYDEAPRAVYSVTISGKNANTKPKPATKKSSVKPPPAAIVDIKG